MSSDAWVLLIAAALGVFGAAVAWHLLGHVFDAPLFARENVRGRQVPVAVGVVIPIVLIAASAIQALIASATDLDVPLDAMSTTVVAAVGFALLGLLDDLAGDRTAQGFGGHLRALGSARLTTGAVKLFGGGALAMVVASPSSGESPGRLLADAALIALSANLANLLDRAPGRVTKVALVVAGAVVLAAGVDPGLAGTVVVAGAAAALLVHDLHERLMLGDTGANVLGGVLGLAVVLSTSATTRNLALLAVALANLASERVSFSRVIDATPPLRWLDRLGRLP